VAVEVLDLIVGDGGKTVPGPIHGLYITVSGGQQSLEGFIGLVGMGLVLSVEEVQ
jgi:hypothetical protein